MRVCKYTVKPTWDKMFGTMKITFFYINLPLTRVNKGSEYSGHLNTV